MRSSAAAHILSVRHVQSIQAKLLAQSGIARAEYFLNGGDGHNLNWETDKFEEKIDNYGTITLSCKRFGAFSRVASKGKRLIKECVSEGLMGRDIPDNLEPVITLSGSIGGMVLDRNTRLKGNVAIHHGKVVRGKRRDRIPGSEKWTIIKESPPLPFDRVQLEEIYETLSNQMASLISDPNSIHGRYTLNNNNDSLLTRDRIVILGDCTVQNVRMDRKTLVVAGQLIIEKGVSCEEVQFLSEKALINGGTTAQCLFFSQEKLHLKGGNHKSQFIATDSIVIEKEAIFSGSNVWVCYRKFITDSTITGGVYFPQNSDITGHVICFSDTTEQGSAPFAGPSIVLGKRSSFTGCLITNGSIDFNSINFEGHIWARSLATNEKDVLYKNWLFNCKISPLKKDIPFPLIGELPAKVSLIQ